MILLIFLSIFVALILILLLSPIRITINSDDNIYDIKWRGIGSIKFSLNENEAFTFRLKILFWTKKYAGLNLINRRINKRSNKKQSKIKKHRKSKKSFFSIRRIYRLVRSWKILVFNVELDSDNVITNAYLYPIFSFLNNSRRSLTINNFGNNRIQLSLENSAFRMIRALFFKN